MTPSEKVAYLKGLAEGLDISADDKNVSFIEELILDDEDDCDEDYDDDDDESFCCSSCCGCDDEADYEVTCPQCGEVVPVYEDDLSFGNIICPGCGETLEFDFDETDEPDGED